MLIFPVFLGADNSVKLGDFGLSKLMQSHDFASTYVGTPFYMSPEICAAERYTLQSDIWSLGCIMYELCARQPPFNAKTHFHLVQKIKEGRFEPLPSIYSPELQGVIKSCLKTNPLTRPDTASLIQLPVVRLMRKEREVVELGKVLKTKEELALQKTAELKARAASLESEKEKTRAEIEATVRREWEVKARLEIDRQLQIEMERLQKKFENDVQSRVELEVQKQLRSRETVKERTSESPTDIPLSSVSTCNDTDFPSTTDLSSLSIESPVLQKSNPIPPKKSTRTPFARARTQYDSPMDIQMAEPSPMSIASLSLSPRRTAAAVAATRMPNSKNIFAAAAAAQQRARWEPHLPSPVPFDDDEEENDEDLDDIPELPSPTRASRAAVPDPFKAPTRPGLLRQKTAPIQRHNIQPPPLFTNETTANTASKPLFPPSQQQEQQQIPNRVPKPISPNRRLSRLPSSASNTNLKIGDAGSPIRRVPPRSPIKNSKAIAGGEDMFKAVVQRNMLGNGGGAGVATAVTSNATTNGGGRTLVELAQARAGGISAAAALTAAAMGMGKGFGGGDENLVVGDGLGGGEGGIRMAARVLDWEKERDRGGEVEVPMWDPEIHEMPSPFLRRGRAMVER